MQAKASSPIQSSRYTKLTICPCCGFKFAGDLKEGCTGCGARAVGEPLARPAHMLPAYGPSLLVGVIGAFALLLFLVTTLLVFVARTPLTFDFWSLVSSAETAAWSLKWMAAPLAALSIWLSWRICANIRQTPARFLGTRLAHGGLAASITFAVLIATFIGITVPERLRQNQRGVEAAHRAKLYTHNRVFMEYRTLYGTFPTDLADLRKLPDPDGSIANLITESEQTNYKPWTELAATRPAPEKSSRLRGAALRPASLNDDADGASEEGVPFTNYELRLPGDDKILGTDDDWLMRDGMVQPISETDSSSIISSSEASRP